MSNDQSILKQATQALNGATIEILLEVVEGLQTANAGLMGDLQGAAQDWLAATQQNERLRIDSGVLRDQVDRTNKLYAEAKAKVDEQESQIAQMRGYLKRRNVQFLALTREINDLRAQVAQAINRVDEITRMKDWAANVEKTRILEMYQTLEAKHLKLIDEMERVKGAVDWLNNLPSTNEAAKKMALDHVRLTRINHRLAQDNKTLTGDNQAMGGALDDLMGTVEERNQRIAALGEKASNREALVKALDNEIVGPQARINDLDKVVTQALAERDQALAKFEELTQHSARRYERIQAQRQTIHDQHIQIRNFETDVTNLVRERDNLKARFEAIAHENQKVSERAYMVGKDRDRLAKELEATQKRLQGLSLEYTDYRSVANGIVDAKDDTIKTYRAKIDQMAQSIEDMDRDLKLAQDNATKDKVIFLQHGNELQALQWAAHKAQEGVNLIEIKHWIDKAQMLLRMYSGNPAVQNVIDTQPKF